MMSRESMDRIRLWIAAGLLMVSVLFVASCDRKAGVHAANPIPPKPDPLLGKWVMIADNGGGGNGTIADFQPDGTVVITLKGKKTTGRYRREPGKAWWDRRAPGLREQGIGKASGEFEKQFTKPGIEMVEFADTDGKFLDYGGSLLTLDPERRLLYNPITQLWCRPGEEARANAAMKEN
jgi:hypothetical protein